MWLVYEGSLAVGFNVEPGFQLVDLERDISSPTVSLSDNLISLCREMGCGAVDRAGGMGVTD